MQAPSAAAEQDRDMLLDAGFETIDILPIDNFFFRFYRPRG